MAKVTIVFTKDDIVNGETSIAITNPYKAKRRQTGGRLIDIQDVDEGWMLPNKEALKMIMDLRKELPHLRINKMDLMKFKVNMNNNLEVSVSMESNTLDLWRTFNQLWGEYLDVRDG